MGKSDTSFSNVNVLLASVMYCLERTSKIRRTPFPDGALFPQALSGFLYLHYEIDKLPSSRLFVGVPLCWRRNSSVRKPVPALIAFGIQNSIRTNVRLGAQKKNINIDCLNEFLKIGETFQNRRVMCDGPSIRRNPRIYLVTAITSTN